MGGGEGGREGGRLALLLLDGEGRLDAVDELLGRGIARLEARIVRGDGSGVGLVCLELDDGRDVAHDGTLVDVGDLSWGGLDDGVGVGEEALVFVVGISHNLK